jgi:hypothetical protein
MTGITGCANPCPPRSCVGPSTDDENFETKVDRPWRWRLMNDDQSGREHLFRDHLSILSCLCSMGVLPSLERSPLLPKRHTTIAVVRRSIGARERGSNRSTRLDLEAEALRSLPTLIGDSISGSTDSRER